MPAAPSAVVPVTATCFRSTPALMKCVPRLYATVSPASRYVSSCVLLPEYAGPKSATPEIDTPAPCCCVVRNPRRREAICPRRSFVIRAPTIVVHELVSATSRVVAVPRELRSDRPPALKASCSSRLLVPAIRPTTAPPPASWCVTLPDHSFSVRTVGNRPTVDCRVATPGNRPDLRTPLIAHPPPRPQSNPPSPPPP